MEKTTKVVCPKCGAEFDVVAEHSHVATGMVIGKDSGLGTIYMPTKDGSRQPLNEATMQQKMQLLEGMGFDVKAFMSMAQSLGMKFAEPVAASEPQNHVTSEPQYDETEERIKQGNWLENARLFRRFLPAHTLRLLFGSHWGWNKNGDYGKLTGDHFTQWLHNQPDMYEWKVLINEFNAMDAMQHNSDADSLGVRQTIWTKDVVLGMLREYLDTVEDFVKTSRIRTYHKHTKDDKTGCYTYERIKYYKFHGTRNYIAVDELDGKVYAPVRKAIAEVEALEEGARGYFGKMLIVLREFKKHVQIMPRRYNETRTFADAFKAAGGYYTLEDFIRHNGWVITPRQHNDGWGHEKETLDRNESLKYLHRRLVECVSRGEGYKMLGLLKQVASDNHFDYEKQREEWASRYAK